MANTHVGNVDFDGTWKIFRQSLHLQTALCMTQFTSVTYPKGATLQVNRNLHDDLFVIKDLHEVCVHQLIRYRVVLSGLQNRLNFVSVDIELNQVSVCRKDEVFKATGIGVEVDVFLSSINDARNQLFTTQSFGVFLSNYLT